MIGEVSTSLARPFDDAASALYLGGRAHAAGIATIARFDGDGILELSSA
jgi:hypothetical protein